MFRFFLRHPKSVGSLKKALKSTLHIEQFDLFSFRKKESNFFFKNYPYLKYLRLNMKIPKAVYTILIPEKLEQIFKLFHEKY